MSFQLAADKVFFLMVIRTKVVTITVSKVDWSSTARHEEHVSAGDCLKKSFRFSYN